MVVKSLEDNFEQKIAEELDQLQGNLETQKKLGLEEQHAIQDGKEKANDSTEISENETENTDTESFGVPDEISIESFEQYEKVEVGHLEKKIGSNEMIPKNNPLSQINSQDVSDILDKECAMENKVFRNYLLPPLLLDLKIVSKTSELPLASSLVDWIKTLVAPVQDIVETSVLPLGERLMKAVDENLVSNLSEETAGWMAQTKAKLSTIIQHTDDVACQILDAFVLNPVNVQEKEVKEANGTVFDHSFNYIAQFKVIKFGIELFNLWIAFMVMLSMFGFFTMIALFAPFSMVALFMMIASAIFMCLLCIFPVAIFFAVPTIIIGTLSSFFYILLY